MVGSVHLVSFYGVVGQNENFLDQKKLLNRQILLNRTALDKGDIDHVHSWNLERLVKTSFYKENKKLLNQARGCGYWAWKPFIILETLKSIDKDDYVIYCDIGRPSSVSNFDHGNQVSHSLLPFTRWAEENGGMFPGVYLPHHGPASKWIKQDCFSLMGCDSEKYKTIPTIQAGYTAWKNTEKVVNFLDQWLTYNKDERLISDKENTLGGLNSDDFIRHCHDQATLTLLCEKNNISAFGDRKYPFWGFRNINFVSKKVDWELKKKEGRLTFSSINKVSNLLPKFLNSWIELLFEYRLKEQLSIHIINSGQTYVNEWQTYFKNADIYTKGLKNDNTKGQYDLVITKIMNTNDYSITNLLDIYSSIREGGLAVIGPIPETEKAKELVNYSRQISKTETFLSQYGDKDFSEYTPNMQTLKIPNSKNPVFLKTANELYILFYKPIPLLEIR